MQRWFNTQAFAIAPADRRGNGVVGQVLGPGVQLWDLSLRKRFAVTQRINAAFQADFFNAFNLVNYTGLSVNMSSANYGAVTTSAPARNIQLGLKLRFRRVTLMTHGRFRSTIAVRRYRMGDGGFPPPAAFAAPKIKTIKIAVTNPGSVAREAEPIVLSLAELKKLAPELQPTTIVVTVTDAKTIEEDAAILQAEEVPSQIDDLDGNGTADELAFQVKLAAGQTRLVTIAFGDAATMMRLKGEYPARTLAKFATRYEGAGWESERTAWRLYFDKRNAIDLFGKRRPGLYLETFATPGYDYHAELPIGRDIYRNGDALGIGSIAALVGRQGDQGRGRRRSIVARDQHRAGARDHRADLQGLEARGRDSRRDAGQPVHAVGGRSRVLARRRAESGARRPRC